MTPCPSPVVLDQLIKGLLGEEDYQSVEQHVQSCLSCQEALESMEQTASGAPLLLSFLAAPVETTGSPSPRAPASAGTPSDWPDVPGYEVLELLGSGGMGVVYRARQRALGRAVALKMVRGDCCPGPEQVQRFRREAEAVARLQHPNIVQIYETGEVHGSPFFSMELLEGGSLRSRRGSLAPRESAGIVEALARAMHEAHSRGIVHRDLKPGNVLLTADGTPRVTDFGLARDLSSESMLTPSGAVLGTPAYMAPEQAEGKAKEAGPAADVYSLGAILYELLTGEPPFQGPTIPDVLVQVLTRDPVPPRHRRPGVPRDLETICLKCLQKAPDKRYPTAKDLADDLKRYLDGRPIEARPAPVWERGLKYVRRRPVLALAVVVAFVACLGLAAWSWEKRRADEHSRQTAAKEEERERDEAKRIRVEEERKQVKVEYFANLIRRRGVPEGVRRLTEDEARRRHSTFKFFRRDGRVEKVEVVNGLGYPSPSERLTTIIPGISPEQKQLQECVYEFAYAKDGHVKEETARDQTRRAVWGLLYAPPARAHYTDSRGYVRSAKGTGAAYVEFEWREDGLAKRVWYRDSVGRSVPDSRGVYGEETEYDERGLTVATTTLDKEGRPTTNANGYARAAMCYDERGNRVTTAFFGVDGKPVLHKVGYACLKARFDECGNRVELASFGIDGKPASHKEGNFRLKVRYDERGNRVELAFFGVDGKPVLIKNGYAGERLRHDERGNVIEVVRFGLDGKPILSKKGGAGFRARYDQRGNQIEEVYLDTAGNPTLIADGYAGLTMTYDALGRQVKMASIGPDGKPILSKDGYASYTSRYDERGNLVEAACFGVDGKPTLSEGSHASWQARYDERGNQVALTVFGLDGKPTLSNEGYFRIQTRHDELGNPIERSYFGVDGQPTLLKNGFARMRVRYDERGNKVETAYFGLDARPILHKEGFARIQVRYDERGNKTEEVYLGVDGQPTLDKNHCARLTMRYDARDNRIEMVCFGLDGKPTLHKDGYARSQASFDQRGNRVEEAYFGLDGNPTRIKSGFARATGRFDDQDHRVEVKYFGVDGKPTLHRDGYARSRVRYNERGKSVEVAYLDLDDKPTLHRNGYARATTSYDARDNVVEVACFGLDGKLALHREGHALFRARYDERGKRIDEAYFGIDRKPALNKNGCAGLTMRYDERGNRLAESYFGINGKPTLNKDGFARRQNRYDEHGRVVEEAFFGLDDQPTLHHDGFARTQSRYDERGNKVEEIYFGIDGKLVRQKGGYARKTIRHDLHGNIIELAHFGVNGEPVNPIRSSHRFLARFDARGKILESAHFGINGEPASLADLDTFRTLWRYDATGNTVERLELGPNSRPRNTKNGWAKLTRIYNSSGALVERTLWKSDPDGRLRLWQRHDGRNRLLEEARFTDNGRPRNNKSGWARKQVEYEAGKRTTTTFFRADPQSRLSQSQREILELGPNGRPRNNKAGWAKATSKYDPSGASVENAYWKADRAGLLRLWRRENAQGKIVEQVNLSSDGRPLLGKDGIHRRTARYDFRGNPIERVYFGLNGAPVNTTLGYHRWIGRYDERGKLLEQARFGVNGEPAFAVADDSFRDLWRHDSRGNVTEILLLGPNGRPRNNKAGWARRISLGDQSGNLKETAFWRAAPEGKLLLSRTVRYDRADTRRVTSHFDGDGKPALGPDGYHRAVTELDGESRPREERFLDIAGKPVLHRRGYARLEFDYRGKVRVATTAYDLDGKAVPLVPVVESLTSGSMADSLGLKKGDILLYYRGETCHSSAWLFAARNTDSKKPGLAEIEVQRGEKRFKIQARPGLLGVVLVDVAKAIALPRR